MVFLFKDIPSITFTLKHIPNFLMISWDIPTSRNIPGYPSISRLVPLVRFSRCCPKHVCDCFFKILLATVTENLKYSSPALFNWSIYKNYARRVSFDQHPASPAYHCQCRIASNKKKWLNEAFTIQKVWWNHPDLKIGRCTRFGALMKLMLVRFLFIISKKLLQASLKNNTQFYCFRLQI